MSSAATKTGVHVGTMGKASADAVVQAVDLRRTYRMGRVDVPVLKGASLRVRRGEWVAILGRFGIGQEHAASFDG